LLIFLTTKKQSIHLTCCFSGRLVRALRCKSKKSKYQYILTASEMLLKLWLVQMLSCKSGIEDEGQVWCKPIISHQQQSG